jgi:hypothetical protein
LKKIDHRQRHNKANKLWNAQNKEHKAIHSKEYRWFLKKTVVNHYGGKCICCSESLMEFLTVDHIKGGGGKHRKRVKGIFYVWIINHRFPKTLQVLCMNCNFSKGKYGYCPHNKED